NAASHRMGRRAVRRGVAARLMDTILAEARQRGYRTLWLETGTGDVYAPARALYARFGFAPCGPFAGYPQSPHNYFMKLDLS
ncbi:MAG: GNAT family N-acetyltransferase, partial [Pseudomonadota bacterium]